jgi:hypothetical protein
VLTVPPWRPDLEVSALPGAYRELLEVAQAQAGRGLFEATHAPVTGRCGPVIGKRQIEQAVVNAGDIAAFYAADIPEPCTASTLLVLSADRK